MFPFYVLKMKSEPIRNLVSKKIGRWQFINREYINQPFLQRLDMQLYVYHLNISVRFFSPTKMLNQNLQALIFKNEQQWKSWIQIFLYAIYILKWAVLRCASVRVLKKINKEAAKFAQKNYYLFLCSLSSFSVLKFSCSFHIYPFLRPHFIHSKNIFTNPNQSFIQFVSTYVE